MSKSSIITEQDLLTNPTPGEILLEEFLRPLDLSQSALARALRVPPRRINEIVQGKRAITADTDLRLARYFGLTPGFFSAFKRIMTLWSDAANSVRPLSSSPRAPSDGSEGNVPPPAI
jgi:addiction module HigA family antidote